MAFAAPDPKKVHAQQRAEREALEAEARKAKEAAREFGRLKGRILDQVEKCYKIYTPAQQRGRGRS